MPVIEIKPLKSLAEFTPEQYNAYKTRLEQEGFDVSKASFKQLDRHYKNEQLIGKYGQETFDKLPLSTLEDMYHKDAVDTAWNERYNSTGELSPELQDIQSTEAKEFLLQNDYVTELESAKKREDFNNKRSKVTAADFGLIGSLVEETKGLNLSRQERNQKNKLDKAEEIDVNQHKNVTSDYKNYIIGETISGLANDDNYGIKVEQQFNQIVNQKTEDGTPLFPYWDAFKDGYQLNDWDVNKKADFIAQYQATMAYASTLPTEKEQQAAMYKGITALNNDMQHEVHEDTRGIDKIGNTLNSILTKGTSSIAQTGLGAYAIYLSLTDPEKFQNFVGGKDENGKDLPWYYNMQYYANMDQFGTWSPEEQKKVLQRGGISKMVNVKDVGEQYAWFTTESLLEAGAMGGYVIGSVAVDYLTLGAGTGLKAAGKLGLRGLKAAGVGMRDIAKVHRVFSNPVTDFIGDFARANIHAISESTLEALGVYNDVLERGNEAKNERLNDPSVKQEIQKRIDDEVNLRMQDLEKSGVLANTYNAVKDNEGNIVGYSSQYDEQKAAITREVTKNVLAEWNKKEDNIIQESAAKAYLVEAATKQIKNTFGDAAFAKYMYAKPIKFNNRGKAFHKENFNQNADGTFSAAKPTIGKYVKNIAKPIIWGGVDEYTDELLNQGAAAFGIDRYKNMSKAASDPDGVETTMTLASSIDSWSRGAEQAMFDPSSFQQAFVGAIAPVMNVNPLNANAAKILSGKWSDMSVSERLLALGNGAINEGVSTYEQYEQNKKDAEEINNVIKEHGKDYIDITKTIVAIRDYIDGLNSGDITKQKDGSAALGYQALKHLERLSMTAEVSPLYNDYMEKLENFSKGQITNEDVEAFLNSDGNKTMREELGEEKAKESARQAIQDNAKAFIEYQKDYSRVKQLVDDFWGDSVNEEIKDKVVFSAFMEQDIKNRYNQLEKKLSKTGVSGNVNLVGQMKEGSFKRAQEAVQARIDDIKIAIDKERKAKEKVSNDDKLSNKEKKSAIKFHDLVIKGKQKALRNAERDLEALNSENNSKIYTADQIINELNPIMRARMINEPEDYSTEQQQEIDKAKDKLIEINPNYQRDINDAAVLYKRIEDSEGATRTILENVDAFKQYVASVDNEGINQILSNIRDNKLKSLGKELVEAVSFVNTGEDPKDVADKKYEIGSKLTLSELNEIEELYPELSGQLDGVKEVSAFLDDIRGIVGQFDLPLNDKGIIITNVMNVVNGSKTRAEAIESIEEALDNLELPDVERNIFEEIISNLENLGYQRDATRLETRKSRLEKDRRDKERKQKREEKRQRNKEANQKRRQEEKAKKEEIKLNGEPEEVDLGEEAKQPTVEKSPVQPLETTNPEVTENSVGVSDETSFIGNGVSQYDTEQLNNTHVAKRRTSEEVAKKESDKHYHSQFLKWLEDNDINLADIIDFELGQILEAFPDTKIQFLLTKPSDEVGKDFLQDTVITVIEYTDKLEKSGIHKKERGGIVTANGKQWLVVGSLMFHRDASKEQIGSFDALKYKIKEGRGTYFKNNPTERFYVNENYYTQVSQQTSGRIVRKIDGQDNSTFNSLGRLLYNESTNPNELNWEDLQFEIVTKSGVMLVGITAEQAKLVHKPFDKISTVGDVFIVIPAANGHGIPVAINPTKVEELEDNSELKNSIQENYTKLSSKNYNERKEALSRLWQLIVLKDDENTPPSEKKTILVGNGNKNIVSFITGENQITFNLDSKDFDRAAFIKAAKEFNPLVNINPSVLSNATMLQMYDAAGALRLDVAKLALVNSSFYTYGVDLNTGKPITPNKADTKQEKQTPINPVTPIARVRGRVKLGDKVYVKKQLADKTSYRWEDLDGNIVTDKSLLNTLYYNDIINQRDLKPGLVLGINQFYLIKNNDGSETAIKVNKDTGEVTVADEDGANKLREKMREISEKQALEKAQYTEEAPSVENVTYNPDSFEDVDFGETPQEEQKEVKQSKPTTKVDQKGKVNVRDSETKSLSDLEKSSNSSTFGNISSVEDVYKNDDAFDKLISVGSEKGLNWDEDTPISQIKADLNKMRVNTDNIDNFDNWLDKIRNCR